MYMSTVTECDNFEEKTLFLLYFGDRVIAPVKCCLTYIYPFIAETAGGKMLMLHKPVLYMNGLFCSFIVVYVLNTLSLFNSC